MKNQLSTNNKIVHRQKRHVRVRAKIVGTPTRPRLAVFRSNQHISVQAIDDLNRITLAQANDAKLVKTSKTEKAQAVGNEIAQKLAKLKITSIVFDRGGNLYHGRIKTLAEAARAGGLKF